MFAEPTSLLLLLTTTIAGGVAVYLSRMLVRERRAGEQRIAELTEQRREQERALAQTCKELRTPIYGVVGLSQSLLESGSEPLSESVRSSLTMVASTGRRLGNLVTEVIDSSLVEEGNLALDPQAVDLKTALEMVLTLSRPLAQLRGVELTADLPERLAPVWADRDRLPQILQNLLSNAIEATRKGSIEVSTKVEDQELMVLVSVPEPVSTDGLLGSPLTRRLVELHNGWMWTESGPPGRRFLLLTLPISDQVPRPLSYSEVLPRLRSGTEPQKGFQIAGRATADGSEISREETPPRILVIDDDPSIREILGSQLRAADFIAVEAPDGPTGLDLLNREAFDMVILDVRMPGMSGHDVCRMIRSRESLKEIPILFLTGLGEAEDLIAGFAVGANDYLVKPVSQGDLVARVQIHLTNLAAVSYRRRLRTAVQTYEEERELRQQLFEARERERRRLAQELHDGPIQDLHALAIKRVDTESARVQRTEELKEVAADLRSICTELRPPALMVGGLASSIRAHASKIAEREPDLKLHLDLMNDGQQLTEATRLHLFRIYQEALSNAAQHASAENVHIRFEVDAEGCALEIRDDGRGFELPKRWVDLARRERFGLVGLVERAEAIRGDLKFESAPGEGTRILVEISSGALEASTAEKSEEQPEATRDNLLGEPA